MSVRIAHPGRYGDLLWALPTMRAIAEREGEYIHLLLPTDPANTTPMGVVVPLLAAQKDYIGAVEIVQDWSITQDAPRMPRQPDDRCLSLGYTSWPDRALPYCAAALAGPEILNTAHNAPDLFFRPWVMAAPLDRGLNRVRVGVHWTDRWFELKLGILRELSRAGIPYDWYAGPGSRMQDAGALACDFLTLARAWKTYDVVLTDCSAAHVLAAAVGVPHVLVVEPEEARHHWVFWPGSCLVDDGQGGKHWEQQDNVLGRTIRPVLGNDRRPTFDSRHTIDAIREALA